MRCGVSDHAILLAKELKSTFAIDTAFITLNSNEPCDLPYPIIHCSPNRLLESCFLLSPTRPVTVLVHFSGYGYSPDGAPLLLANAIKELNRDDWFSVVVNFHELFAKSTPWKSAFWHSCGQKKIAQGVAERADLLVTSIDIYAKWLGRVTEKIDIKILPVFSTVGESVALVPIAKRKRSIAIFGLPCTRQRAYIELGYQNKILEDLGVEEIVDVGEECNAPASLNGIPICRMGTMAVTDLASLLSQIAFGYLSYPPLYLAKSSIFSAYTSQGTIPIISKPFLGEINGIKDGIHLFSAKTAKWTRASDLESCSQSAWNWYRGHRLYTHAEMYAQWLNQ
jgi:hypothetical protein